MDNSLDNSEFVQLEDIAPDILQDIRYFSTYNFVGTRIQGYEAPCALLTQKAAVALKAVSDELMKIGYRLKVFDAYRPQRAVDHFLSWINDQTDLTMKAFFYPDIQKHEIIPKGYLFAKSSHSRGSTVDVTLLDMNNGQEVDMGGPFDFFGEKSHIHYTNLLPTQIHHRTLLQEVMQHHGFQTIETEWWHFTFKEEPYPDTYFNFPVKPLR